MDKEEIYLRAILATIARQAIPPQTLFDIVTAGAGGEKQVLAYNLCNGSNSQSDIAKAASIDKGSLSRSMARWAEAGIVLRFGEGNEVHPLHVYPLPESFLKKAK
jgi:hypothetical protein